MPRKKNKAVPAFVPPLLFMLFDYIGIVISQYMAFYLRNAIDFWNGYTYVYPDTYVLVSVPLLFLIFLSHSRSYRQMKP
ncbi:MAG: hypothetical protein IJS81_00360, partial [Selenomonadaceae bacterium]|nr:hypothetical protein [Selenomonadaceae bacterium]